MSKIENKKNKETIRDYAARLEAVMQTVIDGIITIDHRGIVQSFNPSAERIFGYAPNEVIGQNVKMLMPDPYQGGHDSYIKNYLDSGEKKVIGIGREVEAKRKDGTVFSMELGISEMNISGERMFVGTIRDITERKKAEEEILRSNEELERFAYICSHDLQEPLRMVRSYTQLLESYYADRDLDEKEQKYMHYIIDGATRAQNLISDILAYARLDKDGKLETVDLNEALNTALENLKGAIEEKEALVTYDSLPIITANKVQMVQLFQNLISNGIKYCDTIPEIHINAQEKEQNWIITVEDNGIGIKKAYQNKIFSVFQRLHNQDNYKGTGIGLALCKKIAEQHHGNIWVKSEAGKGSAFFVSFPQMIENTERKTA